MPNSASTRRWLAVAALAGLAAQLLSGCSGSVVDSGPPAGAAGAAGAGAACPLPATAEIQPGCLACIHDSCPTVYADLCAANCGAEEYGATCLSAQLQVGTCLQSNCGFECQRSHGSAVPPGGLPGGPGPAGSGGSPGAAGTAERGGSAATGIAEGGAAGTELPLVGDAGSAGVTNECPSALPLKCGDRLNHSTLIQGHPNVWSGYSGTQRAESGRETLYALSTASACTVVARLKNLQTDLDLLLVPSCNSTSSVVSSLMVSSTPLDLQTEETFTWANPADQISYLVVDGYSGAEGSYTLEVDCSCDP